MGKPWHPLLVPIIYLSATVTKAPLNVQEAMPRYQSLLADEKQVSYRNTVVVRGCDDAWWLGYIQDIDGEYAFIHFNSTLTEARWMHSRDVWPLPSYWDTELCIREGYLNVEIFAALRDEDNGPFRFRPAIILKILSGCNSGCSMVYIKTVGFSSDAAPQDRLELIHEGQVASTLPPSGASLLDRREGMLYTKYWIPFDQAETVLSEPSDKFRMIKHLQDALRARMHSLRGQYLADDCRFHLRIDSGGCMFIIVIHATDATDVEPTHWMSETLPTVLKTHLTSRASLPPIRNRAFHGNEYVFCGADIEIGSLMSTTCISDLTHSLLSDILSHLDLHSRMKTKRVCGLWQLLLNSSRMIQHVMISFESCWQLKVDSDNCFKVASLLSSSVSSATKSLTLLNVFPPQYGFFLGSMLNALEIKLPFLMFKDHTDVKPLRARQQKQSRLKHGIAVRLTAYKHYCNFVVLKNWTVAALFGQHLYDILEKEPVSYEPYEPGVTSRLLPAHEREWMIRLTCQPDELVIDKLQITIPKVILPCRDGKMHMTSRFMCVLNDNFPPVTQDMVVKVTAVRARWLRTLTYPQDWQSIRSYLLIFSGFHSDGRPKVWDDIDLRCVDLSTWSKLAIYGITEVFRV
ncbi:uncharacterized protein LOC129602009 isoform X2 [Paramacrobiotus metropolitanus]|uniref:uncharacterized protein LOC129602009 isoform X2 n=1 Tax=Paramacrobiotus metropolitanus TaxID=2943436 RepID=UPI002445A8C8|nr:uncharacterized protein LOC129602009 isoform X2 [Paramacrobiotus metropolitanus]